MRFWLHESMAFYQCKESLPSFATHRMGRKAENNASGSHRQLRHPDYPDDYTWAFHDSDEIGPVMLAKISKRTGLKPEDL